MILKLGDKKYKSVEKITIRLFRELVALQENDDISSLANVDVIINFIIKFFGNKFDENELIDNLELCELMELIQNITKEMVDALAKKLDPITKKKMEEALSGKMIQKTEI